MDISSILNNITNLPGADAILNRRTTLAKVIASTSFTLMGIIGITGNALVIYAIQKDPVLQIRKQLSNMAILHLAITDFCTTSTVSLPGAISVLCDEYPFHDLFCKFCTFCNVVTIIATIGFLAIVSLDRWMLCKGGGIYPAYATQANFKRAIALVWISCGLVGVGWVSDPDWVSYDFWSGICDVNWIELASDPFGYAFGWYCTILHFIVPTSAIIASNVSIIRMAKKVSHVKDVKEMTQPTAEQQSRLRLADANLSSEFTVAITTSPAEQKIEEESRANGNRILRSMLVVMIVYMFLTAPVAMIRIIKVLGGEDGPIQNIPPSASTVCTILQFSASIVNPLIYGLFRTDFREAYRKILKGR